MKTGALVSHRQNSSRPSPREFAPKDHKSLRLVSKEGTFKTLAIFSRPYFPHQVFYLTSQESLELALKLAPHPAFASTIKTITFLTDKVHIHETLTAEIKDARKARTRAMETAAVISMYEILEPGLIAARR